MMRPIDAVIDSITMYRLLLYILFVEVFMGVVFAFTGNLAFTPGALLISTVFLIVLCWTSNTILGAIFNVPTNVESAILTALILALIFDPPATTSDLIVLGWAAILAMASKYILALHNKHLFNPAAISAVIIGYALQDPASWWVGTSRMLPIVLIGGLLIVRKVRQESMVGAFLLTATVGEGLFAQVHGTPVTLELRRFLIESPLFFFASIMLTEPLTAPPTRTLKSIYGMITGILFIPQVHSGIDLFDSGAGTGDRQRLFLSRQSQAQIRAGPAAQDSPRAGRGRLRLRRTRETRLCTRPVHGMDVGLSRRRQPRQPALFHAGILSHGDRAAPGSQVL